MNFSPPKIIRQFALARLWMALIIGLVLVPGVARPQARDFTLFASPALIDAGLMKFLLPRFSLKTGVLIELKTLDKKGAVPAGADVVIADIVLATAGKSAPAMLGLGKTFYVVSINASAKATRFVDWLLAEIGQRTIEQFKRDGKQLFKSAASAEAPPAPAALTGNKAAGEALSYTRCGRCHVIGEKNRMKGIGSTPSFAVVRAIPDWQTRFETFYTRNPHPSFTQIPGVTPPFNITRPPPISPLELTLEGLDDILAFVATIEAADLGAPIRHQ